MREQTKKLKKLVAEFHQLKRDLFNGAMFAVFDDNNPKTKRYNELYRLLYLGVRS